MRAENIVDHKHPVCQAVIGLVTDLEACLLEITSIPSDESPTFHKLIEQHKGKDTFSDYWGVHSARFIRNRISHKPKAHEPALTLPEVERAKATFEHALRDVLPRCSQRLQDQINREGKSKGAAATAESPSPPAPPTRPDPLPETKPATEHRVFRGLRSALTAAFLIVLVAIFSWYLVHAPGHVRSNDPPTQTQAIPKPPQSDGPLPSVSQRDVAPSQLSTTSIAPSPTAAQSSQSDQARVAASAQETKGDGFRKLINSNLSLSSSQPNVALLIDSTGPENGYSVTDGLQGFLADTHRTRLIGNLANVNALKAAGLFDDLYAGHGSMLTDAVHLSRVDYILIAKAKSSFRKQPDLDPDLLTCDLSFSSKLVDHNGSIVGASSFSVNGAGFTRAQALERAVENAAQQLQEGMLGSVR